jgi:O-antigen ligase
LKIRLPKKLLVSLEKVFIFLVLQLFAGAIVQTFTKVTIAGGDFNNLPQMRPVWFGIYTITLLLTLRQWKQFIHVATKDKFILLLIAIALVSIVWSVEPQVTLRRSMYLAGTTWFGVYLATRYTPSELVRLIAWTFSIGALLSLVLALALPTYGLMEYQGMEVWRGIYRHKNLLGRLMALNAIILLLLAPNNRRYRWVLWAVISLSLTLLLLSQTKTGLVIFLILLILLPIYGALQWSYTLMVPFLIVTVNVAGILAIWLLDNLEPLVNLLGKDLTLTGRTDLWAAVINKIQERPLLGYGYSAFWQGWEGESAFVLQLVGWDAPNGHNGILDLWVDLGFLGVGVFLLGFFINFIRGMRWVQLSKTAEPIFLLQYLTFMIIDSQASTNLLLQNDIFWVLYVAMSFSIPRSGMVNFRKH